MQQQRTRRARGTGTIWTENGRWKAKWYKADGVQTKATLGPARTPGKSDGMTRVEAEAEMRKRIEAANADTVAKKSPRRDGWLTIEQLSERYIEALRERGAKDVTTLTDYRSATAVHFTPFFGETAIQRISDEKVEAFKKHLMSMTSARTGKPLSPKTVHNYLSILRAMFNWAVKNKLLAISPMFSMELPSTRSETPEDELQFLTPDEVRALADAAVPGDYYLLDRALYLTAAMTGKRQGELRGLQWQHIDWDNSAIRVRRNMVRGQNVTDPKGKKSRPLPMPDEVADALLELRASSPWTKPDDPVFATASTGNAMDRTSLMERYRIALAAAGLPVSFRFHDLRHTFGTTMAAAGIPIWQIQQWMGHAQASTTEIYLHYKPRREEAEMVSAAFGSKPGKRRLRRAA